MINGAPGGRSTRGRTSRCPVIIRSGGAPLPSWRRQDPDDQTLVDAEPRCRRPAALDDLAWREPHVVVEPDQLLLLRRPRTGRGRRGARRPWTRTSGLACTGRGRRRDCRVLRRELARLRAATEVVGIRADEGLAALVAPDRGHLGPSAVALLAGGGEAVPITQLGPFLRQLCAASDARHPVRDNARPC